MDNKLIKKTIIGTMLALPISPIIINNISLPQISQKVLADTTNGVNNIDSLTETLHQPLYHLETDQGWSNDVQSLLYNTKNNDYDVYFLHSKDGATNPFGPSGQDWHHTTSKDLEGNYDSKQNVAIESHGPSNIDDTWKSAWTGSVTYNQGNIPEIGRAHV